ncbi:MAG: hypothetical protein ACJ8AI_13935 [Rhodopila sp.]
MPEVTLEMLQTLVLRVLTEQQDTRKEMRDMRREMGDVRGLVLALNDKVQRIDRDLHEVKDDIWIMLKAALMGRQGNFETRVEARLEDIEERLPPSPPIQ